MTNNEFKWMVDTLRGNIAECQNFHPDFNDESALYVRSFDKETSMVTVYYVIKLGVLKQLIDHASPPIKE